MIILAVDFGEFKSVACVFDAKSNVHLQLDSIASTRRSPQRISTLHLAWPLEISPAELLPYG